MKPLYEYNTEYSTYVLTNGLFIFHDRVAQPTHSKSKYDVDI